MSSNVQKVALDHLDPNPANPRRALCDIAELSASIAKLGLLQPILVKPSETSDRFQVVAGHRRLAALRALKKAKRLAPDSAIPVLVLDADADAPLAAIVENVQRSDMPPLDEAQAWQALLDRGQTIENIAAWSGKSEMTIRRRLCLLSLPAKVQQGLASGKITLGQAQALTIATPSYSGFVDRVLENPESYSSGEIARRLKERQRPSAKHALFPLESYTGAFVEDLFSEDDTRFFADEDQFYTLQQAALDAKVADYRAKGWTVDVLEGYFLSWEYEKAKQAVVIEVDGPKVTFRTALKRREQSVRPNERHRAKDGEAPPAPAYSQVALDYLSAVATQGVYKKATSEPRLAQELTYALLLSGAVRPNPSPVWSTSRFGTQSPPLIALARELTKDDASERFSLAKAMTTAKAMTDAELSQGIAAHVAPALFLMIGVEGPNPDAAAVLARIAPDLRADWSPDAVFFQRFKKAQLETFYKQITGRLCPAELSVKPKREMAEALAGLAQEKTGKTWLPALLKVTPKGTAKKTAKTAKKPAQKAGSKATAKRR